MRYGGELFNFVFMNNDIAILCTADGIDILSGLLFYPEETVKHAPKTFNFLAKMHANTLKTGNEYAYNEIAYQTMYNIIGTTYVNDSTIIRPTPEAFAAAFDELCDDNCSMIVFESWDQEFYDINKYFYQVSCLH
jgi:hypothetical protein